ncbi:hypothetical protein GCM10022225_74410 [Plantactinospora mayteni]|uniref:Uncharacterized protein n=1 Tax=Plantactinospora mayteni TaxID=566021 RepID=A0ABQ4EW41_9ACTN|nr:hypothetical protein [Plantactinospora mayteni]GIG98900.1 hypothetical protein Pma05_54730 [Plantactinospora mayteni]
MEKLADAAAKTNQGVMTVVLQHSGLTADHRMDPANKKATMSIAIPDPAGDTLRAELIQIGTDLYVRTRDLPGVPKMWMHIGVATLPAGSSFNLLAESDHTGAADLVSCVVTAKRKGGADFVGTLDLTRSHSISRKVLDGLGPKATAVPFSAVTSPDGNFFEFNIDVPSVDPTYGALRYTYSRSDGVDAKRPAASEVTDITALPRSVIDRFEL